MNNKYLISKYLVKTDPKTEEVLNTKTGVRHEVSDETLKLLELFSHQPKSINEALAQIECGEAERRDIYIFIEALIAEQLLVAHLSKEATIQAKCDANAVIFESPMRSFFSVPIASKESLDGIDIAFVGVPFDLGTTGYPGARFAPDRMRELSSDTFEYHSDIFTGKGKGWWSADTGAHLLRGQALADFGNVLLQVGEGYDSFYERVTLATSTLLRAGIFPILVGGDHSLSFAAMRSFKYFYEDIKIVHIDAHTDMGELIPGIPNNHGNVFTRIMQDNLAMNLFQIGVRGTAGKQVSVNNYKIISLCNLYQVGIKESLSELNGGNYYLSIDIDVLDPSFAPGTGTPVSKGMDPTTLISLISEISHKVNIVGMDIVEINPMLDRNDQTSELGLSIILHVLSEVFSCP